MISKVRLTLDLKESQNFDTLILHRGDSNSRVIEIELTDAHAPVTLTAEMSATISASTNGVVVADGETAMVDTDNNIISFVVTDNMTSLPGQSKISLTVTENDTVITAQTFRAIVVESVINEGSKFEPTSGTIKEFIDEILAAIGSNKNLKDALDKKENKSYKISDKTKINDEAENYPSIAYLLGYYYDYHEIDELLSGKLDNTAGAVLSDNIAGGAVKTDKIADKAVTNGKIANGAITATKIAVGAVSGNNIAQGQINAGHLQSGAVTVDKFADEVKATINGKADKSTTYTKTEVNNALSSKLDNAEGSVTRDNIDTNAVGTDEIDSGAVETINIADNAVTADKIADKAVTNGKIANGAITATKIAVGAVSDNNIAQGQINTGHLQSGAVTSNKLADEVKASINSKYDNSNVETGSGVLTPYNESMSNKINSASFSYQRNGSYVTVSVYIDFKAFTVDNTGVNIMLLGLPYVCKNAVNPRELCVTTSKQQIIYAVTANTSNLTLLFINTGAFAENEKLSFTVTYKIS